MSPTVWTPNNLAPFPTVIYQCSNSDTCTCGNCNAAISITENPPITLTNLDNPVQAVAYSYTQNSPSAIWTITHNLNFYPNITVVDSGGSQVEGEVSYLNPSSLVLTFTSAFSGHAYLS